MLQYLLERQKEDTSDLLNQLIETFQETVSLYQKLMFDILQGGTSGWDYLFRPLDKEQYPAIIKVMQEMKLSESESVNIVEKILAVKKYL